MNADPATLLATGLAHHRAGRIDDACAHYQSLLDVQPDHHGALHYLGLIALGRNEFTQAAALMDRSLERAPDNVGYLGNRGVLAGRLGDYAGAAAWHGRALAVEPDSANTINNLAFALTALARYDEAEVLYHRALELKPGLPESQYQLGMLLLRRGDYAQGWPLFESRKVPSVGKSNYRKRACAEWQGEPLAGKRVLICREQGVGDQIQFVRYAGLLAQMGAQVDVWVAPELASLAATVPGVARVLDAEPGDEAVAAHYDYWCDVMSLPLKFPGQLPWCPSPYMRADKVRVAAWRARVNALAGAARRRIGLVWAGNPRHYFDSVRSVPLTALEPLSALVGNAWFSLQKGPGAAQLAGAAHRWPMDALGDELGDFAATASLIEALDLVITVDTSVAHLAGALGKPVWVLLAAQPDWRWGMGRADSAWYPSARLFRQSRLGDWSGVVDELASALGGAFR